MSETGKLPHWDLTSFYPSLDSPEYGAAFQKLKQDIAGLATLFDSLGIRARPDGSVTDELAEAVEQVLCRFNTLYQELTLVWGYVDSFVNTDAANDVAQSLSSELRMAAVTLGQLSPRLIAWIGSMDLSQLLERSEIAREHGYYLRRLQETARHQMSEAEENLSAELATTGSAGWSKLHSDMTALLTVTLTVEGEEKTLPMSEVRNLAYHPKREVRRAAFEAEQAAWKAIEVPMAATLNGVKGFASVTNRRRHYDNDVAAALHHEGLDRKTLEALQTACREAFPDFERFHQAKAKALGVERMAWYDLFAPVGEVALRYSWDEAEGFVREQFGAYSDRMRGLADSAFEQRWIDAEPRKGKIGGAYCAEITPGRSLVLANYDGSYNSVSTLAHELGHAYHNLVSGHRTPLQMSNTPMSLAETASIFCETLVFEAALKTATPDQALSLLENSIQGALQVVVDIFSRFLFEKSVFEKRAERELTAKEFCDLMRDAQLQTYGNGLDPELLHPYMWAVKPHYYGANFYNFPYTFGLLFGLGIYAQYLATPEADRAAFQTRYDELLSSTGMTDAASLAGQFGIDIHSADFWRASLNVIRRRIDEFERLVSAA